MTLQTQAIIAAVLLGIYVLGIAYALIVPPKHRDPHDGMARGCLMFVVIGLLGLGAMLAIGALNDIAWLVTVPYYIAVFPAILVAIHAVRYVFMKMSGR